MKNICKILSVVSILVLGSNVKAQQHLDVDNQSNCDFEFSIMFMDCCCEQYLDHSYITLANTPSNYPSPFNCGLAWYVHIFDPIIGSIVVGDPKGAYTCNAHPFGYGPAPSVFMASHAGCSNVSFVFTPATPTTNAKLTIY